MGKTKTKTKARSVGDSPKPPITIRSTNPKVIDDNIAKLEKAIKGVDEASEISYDNTDSGLTAENVQSAIDEIVEGLTAPAASSVTYDNTDSGLTADDVQEAIDEVSGIAKGITSDLGSISGNSSKYLNVSAASTGILIVTGAENDLIGIAVVHAWSNGSLLKFIGTDPSKITVTKDGNKYTLANISGNSSLLFYINTRGAAPTLTTE